MIKIEMHFGPVPCAVTEDTRCRVQGAGCTTRDTSESLDQPGDGRILNLGSCIWREWRSGTGQIGRVCETAVGASSAEGLIATADLVRPIDRNDTGKEHVPNREADLPSTERQQLGQKPPPARLS